MVLIEEISSPKAKDEKDAGNRFFSNGDTKKAIESYTNAIRKLSDESMSDPSILFSNRAQAYIKESNYVDGLQDCLDAIRYNRKNGKAYYRKGLCLLEIGRLEEAEKALKESLRVCKDTAVALVPAIEEYIGVCEVKMEARKELGMDNKSSQNASSEQSASVVNSNTNSSSSESVRESKSSNSSKTIVTEKNVDKDYVHPDIQVRWMEKCGRGLLLQTNFNSNSGQKLLKRGDILLRSTPVGNAVRSSKEELAELLDDKISSSSLEEREGLGLLNLHCVKFNDTIRTQVLKRDTSEECMQVGELGSGSSEECPSMSSETSRKLSSERIKGVVEANAFRML